jgi:hypothetical protein
MKKALEYTIKGKIFVHKILFDLMNQLPVINFAYLNQNPKYSQSICVR